MADRCQHCGKVCYASKQEARLHWATKGGRRCRIYRCGNSWHATAEVGNTQEIKYQLARPRGKRYVRDRRVNDKE